MEDIDGRSLSRSGEDRYDAITNFAVQIISQMLELKKAPSLELLVERLQGMRETIPHEFDEQIALLRSLQSLADTRLKRAGKISLVIALRKITQLLELCGEIPVYSFGVVVERIPLMEPYAAGRYLEGIEGLAYMARGRGAERHLIALLGGVDDLEAPFAWSDHERQLLSGLVERHEAGLAGSLGIAPVVREEQPVAGYRPDLPVRAAREPAERRPTQLHWLKPQADLVYYTDLLKKLDLIDPSTTDEQIIHCFFYKTSAGQPAVSFRQIRLKLKAGDTHPSASTIKEAIPILLKELVAVDRNSLLAKLVMELPMNDRKAIFKVLEESVKRKQ